MRFYFVDRITELNPGKNIFGFKNVSMSEPYFSTHFPSFPVLPGVIIIESMAQLAGLLIELSPEGGNNKKKAILSIVDRVKFKKIVRPGDKLEMKAELTVLDDEGARADVFSSVSNELVAQTKLTFALLEVPKQFQDLIEKERQALLLALTSK
ncbi:MAG: 3-hydroxyacyl-ACP dehydratase FabZ [Candidatus Riflebacteria bacterium]|nr:3-hydroxyacyl-ACP dehydratase FabZ [Candidatus Riflebacteria bacterium]